MNPKELGKKLRKAFDDIQNAPNPFDPPPDPKRPSPHRARPTFFEAMELFFKGDLKKRVNDRK